MQFFDKTEYENMDFHFTDKDHQKLVLLVSPCRQQGNKATRQQKIFHAKIAATRLEAVLTSFFVGRRSSITMKFICAATSFQSSIQLASPLQGKARDNQVQ